MFSQQTISEIEEVAQEAGIDAAVLLAIAEVESGGKAFAFVAGRKEPLIRFEGHYFDRLISPAKRDSARRVGLTSPKVGKVKNPRSQADRWKLLKKAMKLDRSAALQSVSWGIGQVMGSHWKTLGYASPDDLVAEARRSVAGQVALMMRFIRTNGLMPRLMSRDWAGFARAYNGPAYRRNNYDTRMASAFERHKNRKLLSASAPPKPRSKNLSMMSFNDAMAVRDMQKLLSAAGFFVKVDGLFGVKTDSALRAFQDHIGLEADGIYGELAKVALMKTAPKLGVMGLILNSIWSIAKSFTWQKLRGKG
ncbi:MAG: N-acetylmuramidase domain-containing protein [Pseudomonadota bacterium]